MFNLSWYWSVDRKNFQFSSIFDLENEFTWESTYQSFEQMHVYVVQIGTPHSIVRYQTIKLNKITIGHRPISRLLEIAYKSFAILLSLFLFDREKYLTIYN